MRTCLLNLPYHTRIIRRYSCTYYAPNFLFPPLELMYLGAIIKKWKKDDCILIDAIAQNLSLNKVISQIKNYQPDLLVFLAGIESFDDDMKMISYIKSQLPYLKIIALGYIPSISTQDVLEKNRTLDYIVMNEPEMSFSEIYDILKIKGCLKNIAGVTYRENGNIVIGKPRERIKNLNKIPFPERSLVNINLYNEFLLRRPFTTIQTSRGCPFECTFCIRTYGREVIQRSVENVLCEIEEVILNYKVRTIRFIDDNFTLYRNIVIEICEGILKKNLNFAWSCLSRVDTLDNQMLALMKKAGCKRIYLGIETGAQRLLDFYKKGYQADLIKKQVKMLKDNNIEAVGFFMVGGIQSKEEFKQDISLAKELKLDYLMVEKITPYLGTSLFRFAKDMALEEEALRREKIFYRDFYLRPEFVLSKIGDFIFSTDDVLAGISRLGRYIVSSQFHQSRQDMI